MERRAAEAGGRLLVQDPSEKRLGGEVQGSRRTPDARGQPDRKAYSGENEPVSAPPPERDMRVLPAPRNPLQPDRHKYREAERRGDQELFRIAEESRARENVHESRIAREVPPERECETPGSQDKA